MANFASFKGLREMFGSSTIVVEFDIKYPLNLTEDIFTKLNFSLVNQCAGLREV